jgi:c-di-GMP-binding flagellar brake protein YcgR
MAMGVAGVDHPEDKAVVDVIVPGRGEMLTSFVEAVTDDEITVTVAKNRAGEIVRLDDGERLDLVWKGEEGLRAMPVELVGTDRGEQPAWRLRSLGPATRGQRRGAVRVPLRLTVQITAGTEEYGGATTDVSESGVRAVFDLPETPDEETPAPVEPGPAPESGAEPDAESDDGAAVPVRRDLPKLGAVLRVVLQVDDDQITSQGEIIRVHSREDDRYEVSVRLIGLSEPEQDTIRARVFAEMRDLRRRGLI